MDLETLLWRWNLFGYISGMLLDFATLTLKTGTFPVSDVSIDSRPNEFLFDGSAVEVCHSRHGVEDSSPQSSWDVRSYCSF